MKSTEVRTSFEEFFKGHDHLHMPSFSLIPRDDPTLLLINAGMAPFKVFFEGKVMPPHARVTTIQKCFRTVDIDEVGRTPRHNTFFEMLGNFSFGDYFKKEIIPWSWDYLANWLKIPAEKLYVSVYEEDDEAYDIWNKDIGLPESKISRLGKKDNFWFMAETGPCGPDSEIFYDLGEKFGCGKPDCKPGCDCERWPEIWNLVFTQFNRHTDGTLEQLPKKNVDTGMGMERLCMVLQGVDSVFETDLFAELLKFTKSITNSLVLQEKRYITAGVNSIYVFCDHIRAAAFLLADGVYPSNEGRGYVLRRIIRRCLIHLRKLETEGLILAKALEPIIGKYGEIYPNLVEKQSFISELLNIEEENFEKLIERNYEELTRTIKEAGPSLPGDETFYFYDTLGVPVELIRDMAHSLGRGVDEEGFNKLLEEQKERARKATAAHRKEDKFLYEGVEIPQGIQPTQRMHHECDQSKSKVLYADKGTGIVILDKTPFYAESGGQVGDKGLLIFDGKEIGIADVQLLEGGIVLHKIEEASKPLLDGLTGQEAIAVVDSPSRKGIKRAHTGTHLLHAALRHVLGDHVVQSGSKVEDDEFRFDFTHFRAMTKEELDEVSDIVNKWVLEDHKVSVISTTLREARDMKAMALFEGKYDEDVRMIEIGYPQEVISRELCGGSHLSNTTEVGLFIITAEIGIAAGVRRIFAITGQKAYKEYIRLHHAFDEACHDLSCDSTSFNIYLRRLIEDHEEKVRELKKLKREVSKDTADDIITLGDYIKGINVITANVKGVTIEELRDLGDRIRNKSGEKAAICLTHSTDDKLQLLVMLTDDMVSRGLSAVELLNLIAPIAGGKGGGKASMAQGGGNLPAKVPEVFDAFKKAIAERLG